MKKIFFALLLLCACSTKEEYPSDLISQDKYTNILTELHIAQGAINVQTANDSVSYTVNDFLPAILERNNTTKADFYKTLKWYSDHPAKMKDVYEQVLDNLSRMQGEAENK